MFWFVNGVLLREREPRFGQSWNVNLNLIGTRFFRGVTLRGSMMKVDIVVWDGGDRQAIWNQTTLGDACDALGDFGCRPGSRGGFYIALDGCTDVMLCWGPSYECILYWGNMWPLEVVAWWFWKSIGVCKIVARMDGFQKIVILGILAMTNLFQCVDYRWWLVVGGASRHSWQQGSINVIIKGCKIERRLEGDLKVWV
ncbi:hypothetical protein DEO72_LG6g1060 [Vigna unguiculata]|uniref:Uncharacterized protein n=1 Tax=Vigna unguiculata TaxID=3917 RepID=A0A4D6M739_VIGUN|nr:hypothetical protein DEO72_LG6g1060 [Vigna unguiculata]